MLYELNIIVFPNVFYGTGCLNSPLAHTYIGTNTWITAPYKGITTCTPTQTLSTHLLSTYPHIVYVYCHDRCRSTCFKLTTELGCLLIDKILSLKIPLLSKHMNIYTLCHDNSTLKNNKFKSIFFITTCI